MNGTGENPISSQPVSPRHNSFNPLPSDPNSNATPFDRPLPAVAVSQPSQHNHVRWNINPGNNSHGSRILVPFVQQNDESSAEIDEIVRSLAANERLNSSPIGSDEDDLFQDWMTPIPFPDNDNIIVDDSEKTEMTSIIEEKRDDSFANLDNSKKDSSDVQEDTKSDIYNDSIPIPMSPPTEQSTPPLINLSPVHTVPLKSSARVKTPQSSFSPLFFAQPKNYATYKVEEEPTEDEIIKSLEDFKKKGKVPPGDKIIYFEKYLYEKNISSITSGDYKEAEEYELQLRDLRKASMSSRQEEQKDKIIKPLQERLNKTKDELAQKEKEWKEKLDEAKNKCYMKLSDFDNLQDETLRKFDEKWDDPSFLRTFSKPSSELNQLRKIERKLVLTKRYSDATEVRSRIEIMEKEESNIMQNKCMEEMCEQRNQLVEQQAVERTDFTNSLKRKLVFIKKDMNDSLDILKKRVAKLEKNISDIKHSTVHWKPMPNQNFISPRASSQLNKFRTESYFKPLHIKPMKTVPSSPHKKKKRVVVVTTHMFDI